MPVALKTNDVLGPHVILEGFEVGQSGEGVTLQIRTFYVGNGKVALTMRDGRRSIVMTADAADLIEAVRALVPATSN